MARRNHLTRFTFDPDRKAPRRMRIILDQIYSNRGSEFSWICPHPQPFSYIFWHRAKNMIEKGAASPVFSQTHKQYKPPSLKSNLACVPLSTKLEELVDRGQGFFSHSFSEG